MFDFTGEFVLIRVGDARWLAIRRVKTENWKSPKTRIY